jgi:tetratricopeptide (TPR) repeat protein
MKKLIYILLVFPLVVFSQKEEKPVKIKIAEKQILRSGNDLYKQKRFVDAEVKYKKALKLNPNYETAGYNLGNAEYEQNRFKEALPQYELVAKSTNDLETKAKSFHNIGNVWMKEKQYDKAIAAYKNSLLLNPTDDETRYNLALAQKLKKDEQQNKGKDKNKDKNEDKKDQNKDKKQDQGDDKENDKDQKEGDDNKDKKDQDKGGQDEQKKQQQPKPQPNQLSQQQIQQLLEAMSNEENKTQKKVNAKKARGRQVKKEKDW